MRNLIRGSLVLAVALTVLPRLAQAHYTGYPHRHVGPRIAYGAPPIDRPGVYLGGSLMGDIVADQANSGYGDFISSGAGWSLFLGVRLNPHLALEFGGGNTYHNEVVDGWGYTLDYLTLYFLTADLKVLFPNRSNVRPYVQVGAGLYGLTNAYSDNIANGGGFQIGGGLDIWLNPWWSLGGRLLYHGVRFSDILYAPGIENAPYLSTISLEANLQVHF